MIAEFIVGHPLSSNAGTPQYVDVNAVEKELLSVRGVADLHNLHIWSLNMNSCLISVHVAAGTETNTEMLLQEQTKTNGGQPQFCYRFEHLKSSFS